MRALLIALVAACLWAAASRGDSPDDPEGLWAAAQRYGPAVHGTFLILRRNGELRADISGFSLPVRRLGDRFEFALPDGKGEFRGVLQGKDIAGQWIESRLVSTGSRFSMPVTLHADGRSRWRGEIEPLPDVMTFYLPVSRMADGRLATYVRNPERNFGRFVPASRLELDGDNARLVGTRRGANEESVLASGQRDAGAGLISLPLAGATFDFAKDTSSSSPFWPRGRPGERYRYAPPVARDDGWPVATLEDVGISRAGMERFIQMLIDLPQENVSTPQLHSVLIARHGKLVLEEYFHGYDRDTPHDIRSAGKSGTAVLIGAAMQDGVPIHLDSPVYQTMLGTLPGDLDARKRAMTLEHLVTMTAGFYCDDNDDNAPGREDTMQEQQAEPDWYRYTLAVPMATAPGEKIVYCSAEPNLALGMLEKLSGEPLSELFDRLVGRPLHMGTYHLFLTPTGTAYGAGGHRFLPRDFLKLAQLMLNDGQWDGRQVISREWVKQSGAALRELWPGQNYGYLWNSVEYPYRGRKVHAYFAGGNGGQVFMGIPELDLAIGFTGGNYNDRTTFQSQQVYMPEFVLPAVE